MRKPDHNWTVAGPRVDLGEHYGGSAQTKREFFDSMPAEGREFFRELNAQLGPLEFVDAWKHKPGRGHERK